MRKLCLLAFCTIALLFIAGGAQAQMDCDDCNPYYNYCSEMCVRCLHPSQDGCAEYDTEYRTCGDELGYNCLQDNCNPSWQITDVTHVGYYGETLYGITYHDWHWWPQFSCAHHVVDRVTVSDVNECNYNPYWQTYQYCDDNVDYQAPWNEQTIPDCCAYPFYCNDWHSCF